MKRQTRKQVDLQITVSVPLWLTKAAAKREIRAIFEGYPGFKTIHGEHQLDDVGTGNGIRLKKVL